MRHPVGLDRGDAGSRRRRRGGGGDESARRHPAHVLLLPELRRRRADRGLHAAVSRRPARRVHHVRWHLACRRDRPRARGDRLPDGGLPRRLDRAARHPSARRRKRRDGGPRPASRLRPALRHGSLRPAVRDDDHRRPRQRRGDGGLDDRVGARWHSTRRGVGRRRSALPRHGHHLRRQGHAQRRDRAAGRHGFPHPALQDRQFPADRHQVRGDLVGRRHAHRARIQRRAGGARNTRWRSASIPST